MNFKKIFGWLLLIIGIGIIVFVLYLSYNIFTAKAEMPQVFKAPEENKSLALDNKDLSVEEEMKKTIQEEIKNIMPSEIIFTLFNLIAWSIFAGISIFGGAQISGLGIRLIKE